MICMTTSTDFWVETLYLQPLLDLRFLDLQSGRLAGTLGRSACDLGRSDAIRLMSLGLGVLSRAWYWSQFYFQAIP